MRNLATQGNSFGKSSRMRARWTKGLDFKIPDARREPVEYLWFVGDFASFDERVQLASQGVARILRDAGFKVDTVSEESDEFPPGRVVATEPGPGERAARYP